MRTARVQQLKWYWRMLILIILSVLVNLFSFPLPWLRDWLRTAFPAMTLGELGYLEFVTTGLLIGLSLTVLVLVTIWLERPSNIRQFFKLGSLDWTSLAAIVIGIGVLDLLEVAFLRQTLYEPLRLFLVSLGLWGQPTLETNIVPDASMTGLNLLLLLLMAWIEAPEEVFFRGYVQNHLQEHVGATWAALVGAIVWDAWHISAPAEFFRRLLFALLFSAVFRWRQNTTALAVVHPLLNRLLAVFLVIMPSGK